MRQICRRLLVAVLSVSLCFSTLPPTRVLARGWAATVGAEARTPADADLGAWAAGGAPGVRVASVDADDVDADEDGDAGEPYLGEGAVTLSESAVTIDGVEISRAQFCAAALPGMARLQDTPETGAMSEYARLLSLSAAAEGAVLELGHAIEMTFIRLLMRENIARILALGGAGAFLICAGSIPGVDRDIIVVVTVLGTVALDGVIIGASWLGLDISSYIVDNYSSISVTVPSTTWGTLDPGVQQTLVDARTRLLERLEELVETKSLEKKDRNDASVVVVGHNRRTKQSAIGVKLSEGRPEAIKILQELSRSKYTCGLPIEWEIGKDSKDDEDRSCAETACVRALGGLYMDKPGGRGQVIRPEIENIVMIQPFRPRPIDEVFKPVPVCEKCERQFGRQRFVRGTIFKSDVEPSGGTQQADCSAACLRVRWAREHELCPILTLNGRGGDLRKDMPSAA